MCWLRNKNFNVLVDKLKSRPDSAKFKMSSGPTYQAQLLPCVFIRYPIIFVTHLKKLLKGVLHLCPRMDFL